MELFIFTLKAIILARKLKNVARSKLLTIYFLKALKRSNLTIVLDDFILIYTYIL